MIVSNKCMCQHGYLKLFTMIGGSCLGRVQRLSCCLPSKTDVKLPLRFARVMVAGVVFQTNVVMLMMSVMLGLWPASFSIAEHVAN